MSEDILNKFKKIHEEKKSTDTGKVLKIGIIGTGWIAEPHVNAYLKCPDAKIVACADLIDGKAAAFCKKMGLEDVRLYRSHKELLDNEELDAVSVCTYNCTHAECAIYALEKGVHVLLEKPMCVTLDEAVAIVRAEKASGKVLSIGFQPRFDENMKMIKKIVQNGELGDVYYIQTGGGRRRGIPTPFGTTFIQKDTGGIGALGDIGCYSLDMVLNAVGYPKPLTVSGYKSDFFGKRPSYYPKHPEYAKVFGVDDFAAAFIRLEGGIVLDFRISWAMNMDTSGDTLILGTKAGLRIPSTECWNGTVGGPMTLYHEISGKQVETVIPVLKTDFNLFDMKIRTFLDAVKEGTPSPIPSSQILYNQAIIDGINKSAELGREIEIKIPKI
ncbi:MAG: putative oxidoreductase YcjS [Firmicutes bacterium ADurb.Bin099]|jgi:predicted dehydrogenase|nr:MAG: putative oxidoreductase YcjS [Firmicutes bacterium ADurb.Bin099]HPY98137.1 Gfo/Idh/MocA family oxidoreductase [Clostridia bacterium]HQC68078.1 Gfo/Idh/MocA family oxidoreductase [Clostridia bacterium]